MSAVNINLHVSVPFNTAANRLVWLIVKTKKLACFTA